ncbi:MAG TPA: class I SAM-dependent methyltransferase, partial [Acidimicrobiales bacterium]|nr:class I SAM-dependent methyltransferase [Acidimicrobiales bacterium]
MSTDLMATTEARSSPIDLRRWPALGRPEPAPLRAAAARALMQRIAARTGIHIRLADGRTFGPPTGPALDVADPWAFFTRLGRDGKIGFGEAYMAGEWDSPELVAVLEAMARHLDTLVPQSLQRLRRFYEARQPAAEDNDQAGARRNIARHYDLSNDLFAAFLDQTITYSSALFADDSEPLEQAQARKIDRLLDATDVGARSRVLEIGTGWGELALRAAKRGAHVTTVTLSVEQAALARQRIAAAGLSSQVDVRVEDYRDVTGRYDAVVSVEMIEAVGIRWWPAYFRAIDQRLAVGGRVGLQAILMGHDRLLATQGSWTWIHKYIFPGGIIPSEQAINEALGAHTSLALTDRFA